MRVGLCKTDSTNMQSPYNIAFRCSNICSSFAYALRSDAHNLVLSPYGPDQLPNRVGFLPKPDWSDGLLQCL